MTFFLIFIAVLMVIAFVIFYRFISNPKSEKNISLFMYNFFILLILFVLTLTMALLSTDLSKKAQGKCPEFERLENVYKMK